MISLSDKEVSAISALVGGKTLRSGQDVVDLLRQNLAVSVDGAEVALDPEDWHSLKEQHQSSFEHLPYNEYVGWCIKEAIHLYLWGSTRGLLV